MSRDDRDGATPRGEGEAESESATVVDARGLRCPLPVIRLARAASTMPPGALVTVWSTDPAAVYDVPAWARMRGHEVVRSTTLDDDGEAAERATDRTPATAITVRLAG